MSLLFDDSVIEAGNISNAASSLPLASTHIPSTQFLKKTSNLSVYRKRLILVPPVFPPQLLGDQLVNFTSSTRLQIVDLLFINLQNHTSILTSQTLMKMVSKCLKCLNKFKNFRRSLSPSKKVFHSIS
nr:uncharacterized protein LOC124815990 [Hydra vulgaris]